MYGELFIKIMRIGSYSIFPCFIYGDNLLYLGKCCPVPSSCWGGTWHCRWMMLQRCFLKNFDFLKCTGIWNRIKIWIRQQIFLNIDLTGWYCNQLLLDYIINIAEVIRQWRYYFIIIFYSCYCSCRIVDIFYHT